MHAMLNTAVSAARKAGDFIMRAFDDKKILNISPKGRHDYVTQIDSKAEEIIIKTLKEAYPKHDIIAEESGNDLKNRSKFQWIIDPLDGTLNYINGFPHFCISIALKIDGQVEHGVIYDPSRNELFTASRGRGASLDSKRIRVNNNKTLDGSFIGTGFPVRTPEAIDSYTKVFNSILKQTSDIRRAGSAALDLAYVAAGRLDGFWESGLKIWDLAAGCLMVSEAGGYVGDFEGGENHLESGNVIAGNMKIYKSILQEVKRV